MYIYINRKKNINYLVMASPIKIRIWNATFEKKLILTPESNSDKSKNTKKRRLATMGHEAISAILNKESPNESLTPLPNRVLTLVTKNTRQP